jgi:hypothetical protein
MFRYKTNKHKSANRAEGKQGIFDVIKILILSLFGNYAGK